MWVENRVDKATMVFAGRQLRLRRAFRWFSRIGVVLLLLTSLLDHAGLFAYRGNDWRRFDRQTVHIHQVIDDNTLDCGSTTIRLLGVYANEERATTFSESNLKGKDVTLRLDVPQTRDAAGELLAYVYLTPSDCWNVDLVREGSGYVDRQSDCSMIPELLAAESARRSAAYRASRKSAS
jgi:endonuclease YncB( thermonuclease family)